MIKKTLAAIMIAIPMLAAAQAPKFGTVTVEPILEAMPERANVQTQLETASKTYEDEYKKLTEELDKKYGEFQKLSEDKTTPDAIKERRMQEIQELQKKAQQFLQTAQQDLQRQQAQLMQPIEEKIMTAIKAVGQENGFTFILPEGVAAFQSADVQDVTPLVKAKLGIK